MAAAPCTVTKRDDDSKRQSALGKQYGEESVGVASGASGNREVPSMPPSGRYSCIVFKAGHWSNERVVLDLWRCKSFVYEMPDDPSGLWNSAFYAHAQYDTPPHGRDAGLPKSLIPAYRSRCWAHAPVLASRMWRRKKHLSALLAFLDPDLSIAVTEHRRLHEVQVFGAPGGHMGREGEAAGPARELSVVDTALGSMEAMSGDFLRRCAKVSLDKLAEKDEAVCHGWQPKVINAEPRIATNSLRALGTGFSDEGHTPLDTDELVAQVMDVTKLYAVFIVAPVRPRGVLEVSTEFVQWMFGGGGGGSGHGTAASTALAVSDDPADGEATVWCTSMLRSRPYSMLAHIVPKEASSTFATVAALTNIVSWMKPSSHRIPPSMLLPTAPPYSLFWPGEEADEAELSRALVAITIDMGEDRTEALKNAECMVYGWRPRQRTMAVFRLAGLDAGLARLSTAEAFVILFCRCLHKRWPSMGSDFDIPGTSWTGRMGGPTGPSGAIAFDCFLQEPAAFWQCVEAARLEPHGIPGASADAAAEACSSTGGAAAVKTAQAPAPAHPGASGRLSMDDMRDKGAAAAVAGHDWGRSTALDLSRKQLDPEVASAVASYLPGSTLTSLQLRCNCLGTEGAVLLGSRTLAASQLTCLDLSSNSIGNRGAAALAEGMVSSQLAALTLWNNSISREGIVALARGLAGSRVTSLDLTWNPLGSEGAVELADALASCHIAVLRLAHAGVGSDGAKALGACLPSSHVTELGLGHNPLGKVGCLALVHDPASIARLQKLDLTSNGVGAKAAVVLASAVASSRLRWLCLGQNGIGDKGAVALAGCLPGSQLTKLELWGNDISSMGIQSLMACLPSSRLTDLVLRRNGVLASTSIAVDKILEQNREKLAK